MASESAIAEGSTVVTSDQINYHQKMFSHSSSMAVFSRAEQTSSKLKSNRLTLSQARDASRTRSRKEANRATSSVHSASVSHLFWPRSAFQTHQSTSLTTSSCMRWARIRRLETVSPRSLSCAFFSVFFSTAKISTIFASILGLHQSEALD